MDRRVAKLVEAINGHSGAMDWNLEHACRELHLGISPAYAARLFKRNIGWGVREYAKKRRLLTAIERLIATSLPMKTIAAELGYRKPFDFARLFKKQFGLSPTRFRQANQPPLRW